MSGSEAKAIRRDIRRSFGASAFDEIVGMRAEIATFNERVSQELGHRIVLGEQLYAYVDREIKRGIRDWRDRGFWGRLCWLVRGR